MWLKKVAIELTLAVDMGRLIETNFRVGNWLNLIDVAIVASIAGAAILT